MTPAEAELERYARQLALPRWSTAAQQRLERASAIVVGAGAIGSPAATYLAAAGVGRVGIVDHADVTLADLAAQPLHYTPDIGTNKAESAAAKLGVLNSQVQAEPYPVGIDEMNARPIVAGAAVVLDCSGGEETSRLVADATWAEGVPLVAAWGWGLTSHATSVRAGESPCLRCALAAASAAGSEDRGTLGAMAGAIGSIQSLEALKLLTGIGPSLQGRMLRLDGRTLAQSLSPVPRRVDCQVCAGAPAPQQST